MTPRRPYTYVLLRYRHDPLSGEFANVGVVLHAPAVGFLDARVRTGRGARLKAMFPGADRAALLGALQSVDRGVQSMADHREGIDLLAPLADAATLARRTLAADDSSFVWGPLGSGLSADPAETLARLYARFVTHYDSTAARAQRSDADVWRPVRDRLAELQIAHRLQPKVIASDTDQVEFQHAWKNGAWHVYQPISLDLASSENIRDKAARWLGHIVGLETATESFRPHLLVGRPTNPDLLPDYERAVGTLRKAGRETDVVEEAETDRLVAQIADEVLAHDAAQR